jgi:hypothetical protein
MRRLRPPTRAGRHRRRALSSWQSGDSQHSALSLRSLWSVASLLSVGSAGSVLSIGSAGSVLSIGSAGSVLSIGSAGSVLSIGSAGSVLGIGTTGRHALRRDGGEAREPRLLPVERGATLLGVAALLSALRRSA